jgi:hypothetical protein
MRLCVDVRRLWYLFRTRKNPRFQNHGSHRGLIIVICHLFQQQQKQLSPCLTKKISPPLSSTMVPECAKVCVQCSWFFKGLKLVLCCGGNLCNGLLFDGFRLTSGSHLIAMTRFRVRSFVARQWGLIVAFDHPLLMDSTR